MRGDCSAGLLTGFRCAMAVLPGSIQLSSRSRAQSAAVLRLAAPPLSLCRTHQRRQPPATSNCSARDRIATGLGGFAGQHHFSIVMLLVHKCSNQPENVLHCHFQCI